MSEHAMPQTNAVVAGFPRRHSAGLLPSTPRRWSRHCWPPLSGRSRRLAKASAVVDIVLEAVREVEKKENSHG
jgi:hypothetical protein